MTVHATFSDYQKTILSASALMSARPGRCTFSFCIREIKVQHEAFGKPASEQVPAGEARFHARSADGTYRWVLSRAEPLRSSDATLLYWIGVNLDIDDTVRAEENVSHVKEKLALAHAGCYRVSARRSNRARHRPALIRFVASACGASLARSKCQGYLTGRGIDRNRVT